MPSSSQFSSIRKGCMQKDWQRGVVPDPPFIPGVQVRRMQADWSMRVLAWEPIYLPGYGNACRMLFRRGVWHAGVTANRVFSLLASTYWASIPDLRHWYSRCHGLSQSLPLPVAARGLVFFAVKTRAPQHKHDGAIGYIANTAVRGMERLADRKTRIYIEGDHYIDAAVSLRHVESQRRNAEVFELYLARKGLLNLPPVPYIGS
ncbi:MAG: hypothetical protein K6T83_16280 [Alicyclobacillus sp.]|nr:hypothetical protein [Alicyclobacillus sp.]